MERYRKIILLSMGLTLFYTLLVYSGNITLENSVSSGRIAKPERYISGKTPKYTATNITKEMLPTRISPTDIEVHSTKSPSTPPTTKTTKATTETTTATAVTTSTTQPPATTPSPIGKPFSYDDEVDLRVLVLTFNRPISLGKCLNHIANLDMMGDTIAVEVWVDCNKQGHVNNETVTIAEKYAQNWTNGVLRVHAREEHVGIVGQWVNTWKPREDSDEIGLIIEDDIDISPLAYRWLKGVYSDPHIKNHANLSGVSLQAQQALFKAGKKRPLEAPPSERGFFYGVTGTWGFAPNPTVWLQFQKWLPEARAQGLKPYVNGLRSTGYFQTFEKMHKADSIWAMWYHYYAHVNNLYCFYSNLVSYTNSSDVHLIHNRVEGGLHFSSESKNNETEIVINLMTEWSEDYVNFPNTTLQYNYDGSEIKWI